MYLNQIKSNNDHEMRDKKNYIHLNPLLIVLEKLLIYTFNRKNNPQYLISNIYVCLDFSYREQYTRLGMYTVCLGACVCVQTATSKLKLYPFLI